MPQSAGARPLISFIVASYNYARFIGQTLQSILDQTVQDFEIIVVDDASSDGSRDIVRSFADPRIRLHVNEKNEGLIRTYNRGVRLAKGEYISYLDSDDWIEPRKLEEQLACFRQNPGLDIVGAYALFFDDAGKRHPNADYHEHFFNQPYDFNAVETWIGHNKLHACSVLLARSVFDRIGLRDTSMTTASDYELWTRAQANGCRFGMVHRPLLCYRLHQGNASAQDLSAQFLEMAYTMQINVLPSIEARSSFDLIGQVFDWILAREQFGQLSDEQRCRLLGLMASPEKCRDCIEFKKSVQDDGNPTLLSLGRRIHAMLSAPATRHDRDIARATNVATRDTDIAVRDDELTARGRVIAALKDELTARGRDIAALNDRVTGLTARNQALQAERDALRAGNEHLLASTSWRVTKPLRCVGTVLRGLRLR